MTVAVPTCQCGERVPQEHTIIAMRLHVCKCGAEHEVEARDATEYIGRLLAEIDALKGRTNPFAGIDL